MRRTPGGALLLKGLALVVGLSFIALGLALIVLPGPLTIPPVLVGLYVLSLEFSWADRLLDRAKDSGRQAWGTAKAKPVSTGLVTVGGLALAGAAFWAVDRFDLVARGKDVVGL